MENNNRASQAAEHIKNRFPSLVGLIEAVGPLKIPIEAGLRLDVAMTKIIAGQWSSPASIDTC